MSHSDAWGLAREKAFVSGGWVGPVERGSLNTEPRDGMKKRAGNKDIERYGGCLFHDKRKCGILTE